MNEALVNSLQNDLAIELPEKISREELEAKLAVFINELINHNFQQLVQILYRIDVNESRLKKLLNDNPQQDAGKLIARLIIERQLQKIKLKQEFRNRPPADNEEEKW